MRTRFLTTALSFGIAVLLSSPIAIAQTTVRVEGENFLPPPATGPNESDVVSIYDNDGGRDIEFFVSWDYVEWEMNVPDDGVYSISFRLGSDWAFDNVIPVVLTFWEAGRQVIVNDLTKTAGWGDFQTKTISATVPLRSGVQRFRLQVRPDNAAAYNRFGSGMNLNWIEFTKTGEYPAMAEVNGTVTATVGGAPTPLAGAIVSVGAEYTEAQYVTRTDSTGAYTLSVPAGSHSVTAFYNGFARSTQAVTAPGEQDFNLAYTGEFEAELFQVTNPGPGDANGYQPAFNTAFSNNGILWQHSWDSASGKYAEWRNVIVPEAGVYELSMNYAAFKMTSPAGYGGFLWSANGGPPVEARFVKTFDIDASAPYLFQDSGKVLLSLNQGMNTIRLENHSGASLAFLDTFTLVPATLPRGTIVVTVTNQANAQPIQGAAVSIVSQDTSIAGVQYVGATDANGRLTVPVPVGQYTVTAGTATSTSVSVDRAVGANQTEQVAIALTLTAFAVEAEDFVSAGPFPEVVSAATSSAASGGRELTGLSGDDRREWVDYVVDVAEDGVFDVTIHYKTSQAPTRHKITFWDTSYQVFVTQLPYSTAYVDYTYDAQVPMRAGPNRFRITAPAGLSGGMTLDYIKFQRVGALPSLGVVTGTVLGSDGTATAPVRHAAVYDGLDPDTSEHLAYTDGSGAYSITLPSGSNSLGASAPGYVPSAQISVNTGSAGNFTLVKNLPDGYKVEAESSESARSDVANGAAGDRVTNSGYPKWFELDLSVAQSGLYRVGSRHASDWASVEDPTKAKTIWTVNDVDFTLWFPKTAGWEDFQTLADAGTIALQKGPNTIRIAWAQDGGGASFDYLTFTRTGNLPVLSTDIDNSGQTNLLDATIYLRRLRGLETGATPDVDGNGISNEQDVRRILRVAGGLS